MDRQDEGDMLLKIKESTLMSFDDCNQQCSSKSFAYLGLRYNLNTNLQECWCGFSYGSFGTLVLDSCNYFCAISPQYRCGTKLSRYQFQKILSIYSTIIESSTSSNAPISIIMSRNHIFEGYWQSSTTQLHQLCQWNNDYLIEPSNVQTPNKISTIDMLTIPKLYQCNDNNAEYEEQGNNYNLRWMNSELWTRQMNQPRYILSSLQPYTYLASPVISAEAITIDGISQR